MSDPTPFPTDPMKAEGTDPDLSQDDDSREAPEGTDEERPDDGEPTHDERVHDQIAADVQNPQEEFPRIP